jgi:hypothetical protein
MFRKVILCLWIAGFTNSVAAQLNHYIYLQTDNRQPFYAKLNNKLLSSTASGYLIIPKLQPGSYTLHVGFPKKEFPEQQFICQVENEDLGYVIKNFGEKGWGLFNLQTLGVLMASTQESGTEKAVAKADEFSAMLSEVVNDPSIAQPAKTDATPAKKDAIVQKEDKPVASTLPVSAPKAENVPPLTQKTPSENITTTRIVKIGRIHTEEGTQLQYLVNASDTVTLILPLQQQNDAITDSPVAPIPISNTDALIDTTANKVLVNEENKISLPTDTAKSQEKFLSIEVTPAPIKPDSLATQLKEEATVKEKNSPLPSDTATTSSATATQQEPQKAPPAPGGLLTSEAKPDVVPMINSDCISQATEDDFFKLRKKMAAADNDEDMLATAKKAFKQKCYTTAQVKNLCVLFLKDAGRYSFFDLAYPFVSDSHYFPQLESQLTEPYYINRFKAMVRK